ncbi:MAG: exosortase/archaeosortase family protein [Chthoniobacterales bacterium]
MFSPRGIRFSTFVVLLVAAFIRPLFTLFTTAMDDDLNSYILLIPFVSLYFLFLERHRLTTEHESSPTWAALPAVAGVAALILFSIPAASQTSLNNRTALIISSFVCFVWTGGFLLMGKRWMRSAAFPMLFLAFLIPLPDQLVGWMETSLQSASAWAADMFFALSGTPALKTGNVLELPGISIQVAQECSGIRSTWVLFITSLLAAQLFVTRPLSRLILAAAVIPLGILRNGFRIMVIGLLCVHVDPDMIHSIIHRRGGPIFFVLSLGPLLFLLWILRRRELRSRSSMGALSLETSR